MSEESNLFTPAMIQLLLRKLAAFGSSYLGNDLYYLKEVVDIVWQTFGDEKVIEMLKNDNSPNSKKCRKLAEDWDKLKIRWRKFDKVLNLTKIHWDKIEKKNPLSPAKDDVRAFARYASKIPLIKEDLYTLFDFFMKNSPLSRKTIPSDAWKVLEHSELKKIDATRRSPDVIVDRE